VKCCERERVRRGGDGRTADRGGPSAESPATLGRRQHVRSIEKAEPEGSPSKGVDEEARSRTKLRRVREGDEPAGRASSRCRQSSMQV